MLFLISITTAWISTVLTIFLLAQFIFRRNFKNNFKCKLFLLKLHKLSGIIILFTGFIHGALSQKPVLSFNFGSALLLVFCCLFLSFSFRKKFKYWLFVHRLLAVLAFALFICHMGEYAVHRIAGFSGRFSAGNDSDYSYTLKNGSVQSQFGAEFNDGVYIGSAEGYGRDLTVEILIENNIVKCIDILSHNEADAKFYVKAFEGIPKRIAESQSLDVDTVSGATFSSTGIINAVRDALSKAVKEGVLPDIKPLPR